MLRKMASFLFIFVFLYSSNGAPLSQSASEESFQHLDDLGGEFADTRPEFVPAMKLSDENLPRDSLEEGIRVDSPSDIQIMDDLEKIKDKKETQLASEDSPESLASESTLSGVTWDVEIPDSSPGLSKDAGRSISKNGTDISMKISSSIPGINSLDNELSRFPTSEVTEAPIVGARTNKSVKKDLSATSDHTSSEELLVKMIEPDNNLDSGVDKALIIEEIVSNTSSQDITILVSDDDRTLPEDITIQANEVVTSEPITMSTSSPEGLTGTGDVRETKASPSPDSASEIWKEIPGSVPALEDNIQDLLNLDQDELITEKEPQRPEKASQINIASISIQPDELARTETPGISQLSNHNDDFISLIDQETVVEVEIPLELTINTWIRKHPTSNPLYIVVGPFTTANGTVTPHVSDSPVLNPDLVALHLNEWSHQHPKDALQNFRVSYHYPLRVDDNSTVTTMYRSS